MRKTLLVKLLLLWIEENKDLNHMESVCVAGSLVIR